MNIKPTTGKTPATPMAKKFEKFTDKTMTNSGVNLNEVDNMLNEKEQSLKKKIFKLGKMETLVHGDPKLSAKYAEMAENGEEKYGYHYNETIMNMLFNDYVLHSMKYLQKYKNSAEAVKKRRDKSGIHKLQQDAEKRVQQQLKKERDVTAEAVIHNNSLEGVPYMEDDTLKEDGEGAIGATSTASSGQYSAALDNPNPEKKLEETTTSASSGQYSGPAAWGGGTLMKAKNGKQFKKPQWVGGTIIQESNYLVDPSGFEKYVKYLNETSVAPHDVYDKTHSDSNKGLGVSIAPLDGEHKKDLKKISNNTMLYVDQDVALMPKKDAKILANDMTERHSYFPNKNNPNLQDDGIVQSGVDIKEELGDVQSEELKKLTVILNDLRQKGAVDYDLLVQAAEENGLDLLDLIKHIVDVRKQQKEMPVQEEESKGQEINYIKQHSDAYSLGDMNKPDLNIIKKDIKTGQPDHANLEYESVNEEAVSKKQQHFMGMVRGVQKGDIKPSAVGGKVAKAAKTMKPKDVKDFASTKTDDLPEKVSESMIDNTEGSMVADNPMSMKQKPVANTSQGAQGGVPAGFATSSSAGGAANESTTKYLAEMEELNKFNEDLNKFQNEMKELKEDRKPSALVLLDRLKADNAKNFKKDFTKSDTEQTIEVDDKLGMATDGITDVGDPMKLGQELEEKEIKVTDAKSGEALKNVGDSANQKGDEIPKRNDTKDESHYVNMVRGGQQNLVYDNEPGERFDERRKKDMGDDFYQRGEDYKKMMAQAPMYNKDTQPVEDNLEKIQFDKEKAGWANRQGFLNDKKVAESVVTGKYVDGFNKTRIVDFKIGDVKKAVKVNENWNKLSFVGLGNKYTNKVELNEGVDNVLNAYEFYVDNAGVVYHFKSVKKLNESENKGKPVVNEEFNKMKHLINYKGESYMNTKNNKRYVD